MGKIPPRIAELLVTGFRAAVTEADPVFLGLILERQTGETRFLLTRQQVVDLAQSLSEAVEICPSGWCAGWVSSGRYLGHVAVKSHKRHNAHRWIVSKTKATCMAQKDVACGYIAAVFLGRNIPQKFRLVQSRSTNAPAPCRTPPVRG